MMKNKALVKIIFCLCAAPSWAAYDAFQDKLQRPSDNKQTLDQANQSTGTPLQSADIKEYRDKLSTVQTQVFKEGTLPKGSTLQVANPDNPDTFQVQTSFNQLSKPVQTQVLAQMPEAKTTMTPLLMTVALDKGNVRVDSVQAATNASSKSTMSASVPKVSVAHNAPPAATATAPRMNVPSLRTGAHSPDVATSNVKTTQPGVKTSAEAPRTFSAMPLSDVARVFLGQDAAEVQIMDNPIHVSRNSITQAYMPTNGQEPITVRQVELMPSSLGVKVTVTMPGAAVPAPLVERLTEDKPEGLAIVSSEKNVEMEIALKPDASFSIISVRPMDPQTNSATNDSNVPNDVRIVLNDLDIASPSVPRSASVSNAGFLKGAQQLATVLGISPASIIFETSAADPTAVAKGSLALVTHTNGNAVLIQAIKLPTGENAYMAQGRMGNLSNSLQAEIKARLETSGNANFLAGNPELIVESQADSENGFNVLTIAAAPTEKSKAAVVLWQAPRVLPTTSKSNSATAVRTQPMQLIGVAPASRALIKTVFGEKAGQASFEGVQEVPTVHFVSGSNSNLSVRWNATDRSDRQSFMFVGKPLEFTDAIREAVKTELADDKPKKESSDIQVEFLVDQSQTMPVVKVVDAGPSPREVAERQAQALGLSPHDYLLVDIGSRFLIVVDRGQSFLIPGSPANVRLKSPDGNLTIVANARQVKTDGSVLLIMSRTSIKTNWANVVRLSGGNIDEAIEKALNDNPRSDQFLVRLNPNRASAFIVRPLNPATATLFKPGPTKP